MATVTVTVTPCPGPPLVRVQDHDLHSRGLLKNPELTPETLELLKILETLWALSTESLEGF